MVQINKKHAFYYHVLGQMANTRLNLCHLVGFTHKGIYTLVIPFDAKFWSERCKKLIDFYIHAYLPVYEEEHKKKLSSNNYITFR